MAVAAAAVEKGWILGFGEGNANRSKTTMSKTGIAAFAAAFLTAAAALAQTTATFTLSSDDAAKFKTWVSSQTVTAATAPAGFTVAVGTAVPQTVMLYEIPASVGVATVTKYRYAKIGDK